MVSFADRQRVKLDEHLEFFPSETPLTSTPIQPFVDNSSRLMNEVFNFILIKRHPVVGNMPTEFGAEDRP